MPSEDREASAGAKEPPARQLRSMDKPSQDKGTGKGKAVTGPAAGAAAGSSVAGGRGKAGTKKQAEAPANSGASKGTR